LKYFLITLFIFSSCATITREDLVISELMGRDLNNDGVRDDLEEWIDNKEGSEKYRKALRVFATFSRNSFLYIDDREKSNNNTYALIHLNACIKYLYKQDNKEILDRYNKAVDEYKQYSKIRWAFRDIYEANPTDENKKELEKHQKINSSLWKIQSSLGGELADFESSDPGTEYIKEKINNNRKRLKASKIIDMHFVGKTIYFGNDRSKTCYLVK